MTALPGSVVIVVCCVESFWSVADIFRVSAKKIAACGSSYKETADIL